MDVRLGHGYGFTSGSMFTQENSPGYTNPLGKLIILLRKCLYDSVISG